MYILDSRIPVFATRSQLKYTESLSLLLDVETSIQIPYITPVDQ